MQKITFAVAGMALALSAVACGSVNVPGPTAPARAETAPTSATPAADGRRRLSDCHVHLVDFLQRTDGIRAVVEAMDKAGVDFAVISGMPVVKQWSAAEPVQPGYYLEDDARCYWYSATDVLVARELMSLPEADRKRFHPIICGFNAADRNAADHIRRMLEWYPGLWQGIGEVMSRHDDLTALTYGEVARADSVTLAPVFELAAEKGLPVFLHSNVGSVWKREPIYLAELEGAVKVHLKTRFVWCHAGVSRRIDVPTLPAEVRRLLTAYPNLWVDLSWVVFETYLAPGGKPSPEWVALIEAFPDRFLIGSDKVGRFGNYPGEIRKFDVLLDALKPDTARKVGRDNLAAVLGRKG
jgi:hypothetical protein